MVAVSWEDEVGAGRAAEPALAEPRLARRLGQRAVKRGAQRASTKASRRRRAAALMAVGGIGALGWLGANRASAGASAPTGRVDAVTAHPAQCVYVARPGDTVWSIAVRYVGGGDPRPLVDKLERELGGAVLQPGDELVVP
ncbi:MAG TPA: LysM peptidoglycan-binding domain-containing protein [Acidimicrobiales bacterium]|nr:LysM peptidoglycan-binding domain-containing protein [Acidimicrobiales bacterium]